MQSTIAGVVRAPLDAQRLIDELTDECLCDRADISVLARDGAGRTGQEADAKQSIDAGTAAAKTVIDRLAQGGGMVRAFGSVGAAAACRAARRASTAAPSSVLQVLDPTAREVGLSARRDALVDVP